MAYSPLPRTIVYPNAVELTFPYQPDLITAIKREFPAYSRTYDPDTRAWTVQEPHADRAIRLLLTFFPGAEVRTIGERQEQTQSRRREPLARPDHFAVLCITPDAPAEIVAAVYRIWCKLTYPDALPAPQRDQAHQRMCAINAAYEALRGEGRA